MLKCFQLLLKYWHKNAMGIFCPLFFKLIVCMSLRPHLLKIHYRKHTKQIVLKFISNSQICLEAKTLHYDTPPLSLLRYFVNYGRVTHGSLILSILSWYVGGVLSLLQGIFVNSQWIVMQFVLHVFWNKCIFNLYLCYAVPLCGDMIPKSLRPHLDLLCCLKHNLFGSLFKQ